MRGATWGLVLAGALVGVLRADPPAPSPDQHNAELLRILRTRLFDAYARTESVSKKQDIYRQILEIDDVLANRRTTVGLPAAPDVKFYAQPQPGEALADIEQRRTKLEGDLDIDKGLYQTTPLKRRSPQQREGLIRKQQQIEDVKRRIAELRRQGATLPPGGKLRLDERGRVLDVVDALEHLRRQVPPKQNVDFNRFHALVKRTAPWTFDDLRRVWEAWRDQPQELKRGSLSAIDLQEDGPGGATYCPDSARGVCSSHPDAQDLPSDADSLVLTREDLDYQPAVSLSGKIKEALSHELAHNWAQEQGAEAEAFYGLRFNRAHEDFFVLAGAEPNVEMGVAVSDPVLQAHYRANLELMEQIRNPMLSEGLRMGFERSARANAKAYQDRFFQLYRQAGFPTRFPGDRHALDAAEYLAISVELYLSDPEHEQLRGLDPRERAWLEKHFGNRPGQYH